MEKNKRFSLRKHKFGLVSVALATVFAGATQVAADETPTAGQAANTLAKDQSNTTAVQNGQGSQPVQEAAQEIQAKAAVPTVPVDKAQPGDVTNVTVTATDVTIESKENEAGTEAHAKAEASVTVETTSLAAPGTPVGEKAPVTTTKTATETINADDYTADVTQTVTKTTTEKIIKEADVVTSQVVNGSADIVFIIDKSYSMAPQINSVMQNVETFVRDLSSRNVDARLGLIAYESIRYNEYFDFNGSRFTRDVDAFVSALRSIKTYGGTEEPTVPLTQIATSAEYDWSKDPYNRRFAFLITDEDIDLVESGVPSVEQTLKALQDAKISLTVVGEKVEEDDFKQLVNGTNGLYLDIKQEFASLLNRDFSNHVIQVVQEGRVYRIVTEKYDFLVEADVKLKEDPAVTSTDDVTPTPTAHKKTVYQAPAAAVKVAELPQTGSQTASGLAMAGLALLVSAFGLTLTKKKEN